MTIVLDDSVPVTRGESILAATVAIAILSLNPDHVAELAYRTGRTLEPARRQDLAIRLLREGASAPAAQAAPEAAIPCPAPVKPSHKAKNGAAKANGAVAKPTNGAGAPPPPATGEPVPFAEAEKRILAFVTAHNTAGVPAGVLEEYCQLGPKQAGSTANGLASQGKAFVSGARRWTRYHATKDAAAARQKGLDAKEQGHQATPWAPSA